MKEYKITNFYCTHCKATTCHRRETDWGWEYKCAVCGTLAAKINKTKPKEKSNGNTNADL